MNVPPSLKRLPTLLSASAVALALLLAGCGNSDSSDSNGVPYQVGERITDSTVAAIVSSEYGTDSVLAGQYRRRSQMRLQKLSPDQRSTDTLQSIHRELLRQFVASQMLPGKAKAEDIEVDSAKVNQRLDQIKKRFQSEGQLQKQLARNNMTVDSLRTLIGQRLQTQTLQQQMAETAEKPSAEEVEEYSKENRRIRAQHILIRAGQNASESKVDSARKVATTLIDSAQAGVDFSELARRHSEGPSASQGGDLGFFTEDEMVESFSEAAFALADSGDIAPEPVRTRYGVHVIRLMNAGEPMDTSKARQQMMQERRKDAVDSEIDKLLQGATVRVNPDVVQAGLYEE